MDEHTRTGLGRIFIFSVCLQLIGSFGLARFENIAVLEAAYQTLLILLAHFDHYGFHQPMSRLIVVFLIVSSLVVVAYLLKWFAEYIIGIGDNVRKRTMKAKIAQLNNHYIVCGLGRVGSQVARELSIENIPFVVLDRDQIRVDEGMAAGYLAWTADSSVEQNLIDAGLMRASGLIACLGEDSLNLYITLAAKALNPNIYVVARANRQENEIKLKRAGADRVALPYQIGGYHMASMALRPNVVDYMDIVTNSSGSSDLSVEEMIVTETSRLVGHRLGKSLAEGQVGATVIAINGADGSSKVRPTGNETIYPGDRLIILGSKKDLTQASSLIR